MWTACTHTVSWPHLKGAPKSLSRPVRDFTFWLSSFDRRCGGICILKLNKILFVLVSLRVSIYPTYVLFSCVLSLHFKVEEPLHLMRVSLSLACHLRCSRVCLNVNLSMHLCNGMSSLKNEVSASHNRQ